MLSFKIVKIRKKEFYKTRKKDLLRIIDELFKFSKEIPELIKDIDKKQEIQTKKQEKEGQKGQKSENKGYGEEKDKSFEYLKKIGEHIWRIKTHFKIEIPKHSICRKCKIVLIPEKTLRVRNYNHYMVYKCLNCGNERRFLLKTKKKIENQKKESNT